MKKPLSIIDNDPEVKCLKDSLDAAGKMYDESMEFLKKQAEEAWNKIVGAEWDKIEDLLKSRGLLPDDYEYGAHYKATKYSIGFSDGILYMYDKRDNSDSMSKILDMLFRPR